MKEYPSRNEPAIINDHADWSAAYMQGVQEMVGRSVEPAIIAPRPYKDEDGNPVAVWIRKNSFHASIYQGQKRDATHLDRLPSYIKGWDEHAQGIGQESPFTAEYDDGNASLRFRLYVARANPDIAIPYRYAIEGEEIEGNHRGEEHIRSVDQLSEWQYAMGMDIADTETIAWKLQELKIQYDRYPVSQDLCSGGYNGWKAWGGNFK